MFQILTCLLLLVYYVEGTSEYYLIGQGGGLLDAAGKISKLF